MDPKSSISSVDVPTEVPFNDDTLILDGVHIVQEETPDGLVPVVQMFPTTANFPVVPPSDLGTLPAYLRLFEVVYSGKIDAHNRFLCNLRQLKRVAYYAKMFAYSRPNFIIRLDIRPPVGSNYQIKAYGVPGNLGISDVAGYGGCTFWTSEVSTIYFRINYSLKDYLIEDLDTVVGGLYYDIISNITRQGNPVPCMHTLSLYCPELNPSVTRFVDPLLIPDVGVVPLGRSNITVQLKQEVRNGRLSWVWNIVSLGVGFLAEAIFPGSGNVVKAAVDFVLTVVDKFSYIGKISPADLESLDVHIGDPIYWRVQEATNQIQVSLDNQTWYYVLEYSQFGEIKFVSADVALGSSRNLLGSMYADSPERYTQCIFSADMDPTDVAPYIGNLYWPSASSGWYPNVGPMGLSSVIILGEVQGSNSNADGASMRLRSVINHAFNIRTTKEATNHVASIELDNSGPYGGVLRLKNVGHVPEDSGILFGLFKPTELSENPLEDFSTNLLTRLSHFGFILVKGPTGNQYYALGAYHSTVSEPSQNQYYQSKISSVDWFALACGLSTDGVGQAQYKPLFWTNDDFGKDATGVYFRPRDPSMLVGCMGLKAQETTEYNSPFAVNDVGIKASADPGRVIELDFSVSNPQYYKLKKSQIPMEQMNQQPIVHPSGSGALSGNTDKDPGAASIDVSDEQLPAIHHIPANSRSSRPLGYNRVNVDADHDIMIPFWTMDIVKDLQVATRISPISWGPSGAKTPTHAQYEAIRHMYVGPRDVAGKSKFCYYKVTTTANAFSNGRIIIAQVPPIYTAEQINAFSVQDLSQFPRKEHVLHGPETIIDVSWMLKYPVMDAYNIDDHNGYLVLRVLEFDSASDSTTPRLTVWVRPGENMEYSIPIPPRAFRSPDSGKYLMVPSKHQRELLNVVANANLQDDEDADILEKLYIALQNNLKIHDIKPRGIRSLISTPK